MCLADVPCCVCAGEKSLITKCLRLLSLITSAESRPLSSLPPAQKQSLVYSVLYVLNAHHPAPSSGAEGAHTVEGGASEGDFHVWPAALDPQAAQVQSSCCVVLRHLVEAEAGEGAEEAGSALGSTVVAAGGLTAALRLHDLHLTSPQRVLELLHALSASPAAVRQLVREQRLDVLGGFLRSGLPAARALVTSELWREGAQTPAREGGGGGGGRGQGGGGRGQSQPPGGPLR